MGWILHRRITKAQFSLWHREISFTQIWMDKQSFVVLRKWTALCVNMRVGSNAMDRVEKD
jgi:hypothetical protein